MKSVQNSVSKSVFAAVHNPLKVPAALVVPSGPVSAINGLTYLGESLTYTTEEITYAG